MPDLFHPFFFLLGLIVGSFLNVVIYRYNTGLSVARGRSRCLACARDLRWHELLPLFSFAIQRGRCRRCFTRLSWQYPLVEALTAILFVICYWTFGISVSLLLHLVISCLSLVILVYDLRHKIIPDGLVYAFIALALVATLAQRDLLLLGNHVLAGLLLFAFFGGLWWVSRGRWMGFGDAKLGLGVGLLLGLAGGFSAVVLAFWIGAVASLAILAYNKLSRRRGLTLKSEVPFAPFIILGLWLNLFFHLYVARFFI